MPFSIILPILSEGMSVLIRLPLHVGLILLVGVSGCAGTQQTRSVEQSGFLGDYSMLKEGEKDDSLRIYRNPQADWRKYQKIILDPVTL